MKATVTEPTPLLEFIVKLMNTASKNTARQLLRFGGIQVDGTQVRRPDLIVQKGQTVEISHVSRPKREEKDTVKVPGHIYHEDDAIIVAQKPSGLLTMSTDKERQLTLYSLMYSYMQAKQEDGRVFVIHRLDRNVAGLIVFAKTIEAKTDIQINWETTEKRYSALVVGKPPKPKGRIESWIEEIGPHKVRVCSENPNAKHSITEYETVAELDGYTLLDINLKTGRRHQIRVHLASMGCPIVGDRIYGTAIPGRSEILLFSYFLKFRHPATGKFVTFKIPIPKFYRTPPKERTSHSEVHGPRPSRPKKAHGPRPSRPKEAPPKRRKT